jgi:hypothetical protein
MTNLKIALALILFSGLFGATVFTMQAKAPNKALNKHPAGVTLTPREVQHK